MNFTDLYVVVQGDKDLKQVHLSGRMIIPCDAMQGKCQ